LSNPWKEIRDAVWARAFEGGFTSPQLLVALRLVEHFPNIFPGEQKLARWTRLGLSTVRQAIAELEAARILRVTRNPGRVNQYEFLDRAGNPITQGVPDIGPTPPGAGGAPRQELDHTPPGAGSPTPPGAGSEADPDLKQDPKQEVEAGRASAPEHARALMPHELAERRKAAEATTPGARPVIRYEFREGWKPKRSHRELGISLGLTDHDIGARLHDCRNKVYEKGFTSEDKQFNRELAWAARDKETAAFKRKANNVRDFEQPGHRRSGS